MIYFFLQVQQAVNTPIGFFLWVVSALGGVILALAVYITVLHGKMVSMAKDFTEAMMSIKGSIDKLSSSFDRNSETIQELHNEVLKGANRRSKS